MNVYEGQKIDGMLRAAGVEQDFADNNKVVRLTHHGQTWDISVNFLNVVPYGTFKELVEQWINSGGTRLKLTVKEPKLGKWGLSENRQGQRSMRPEGAVRH